MRALQGGDRASIVRELEGAVRGGRRGGRVGRGCAGADADAEALVIVAEIDDGRLAVAGPAVGRDGRVVWWKIADADEVALCEDHHPALALQGAGKAVAEHLE